MDVKKLTIIILACVFGIAGITHAQSFNLWKLNSNTLFPVGNWGIGSATSPISSGDFTNLTTGVLTVSSYASGGLILATSTTPDLRFQYDTDTGLEWLSDNKIGLYTGNSARMIIDNGGNVGIGTTTPNSLLHVSGTTPKMYLSDTSASANQKHWFFQSTAGSLTIGTTTDGLVDTSSYRALTILNNGNVGIGTTSPATTLSVNGSGYLTGGLGVGLVNTSAGTLQTSGNATIGGTLTVSGTTGTTTIATGQGFTVGSSQFVVQQGSGNVGIGVASPEAKLDIGGIAPYTTYGIIDLGIHRDNAVIYVEGGGYGETNTASLDLIGGRGDNDYINFIRIKGTRTNSVISGARLDFLPVAKTAAGPVEQTAALSIIHNGNVGIGTTSPRVALHVATDGSGGLPASGSDMLVESSGITILNILSSTSNAASVYFGDSGNAEIGKIMYQNNGDYMRFDTNGSERMRITSDGNVGIGTTSPSGKLSITGAGTTTGRAFVIADSNNAERFTIWDSGNVGIGVAPSSSYALNLINSMNLSSSRNIDWGAGNARIGESSYNLSFSTYNGASLAEVMRITGSGNVGIGTSTPEDQFEIAKTGENTVGPMLTFRNTSVGINATTDYILGEIKFAGNDKFAGENGVGAKIVGYADDNWNADTNDYPAYLAFYTNPNGATAISERMRITSGGNVGIGTTSPSQKLSVQGNVLAEGYIDYSPFFEGDAISAIRNIRSEEGSKIGDWAEVDHDTLPEGVKFVGENFTGRDLGKSIQLNLRAIQQLDERVLLLENAKVGFNGLLETFDKEKLKAEIKAEVKEEILNELKASWLLRLLLK